MTAPDPSEPQDVENEADEAGEEPLEQDDGGPLGKGLPWRVQRAEIAEEPGNHGRFAFGCSVAVAIALVAFFVIRLFVMR